ncbi:hypothetical protein ABTZ78_29800 [Streptomyces bauhiniae]|uniref:hypothetical protein n=1 Tax=Streptomyces bauhiniae TaxID=2340725 RepID=UPI0033250E9F
MDDYPSVGQSPAPDLYGRLRVQTADLAPARWLSERFVGRDHSCTVAGVSVPGFDAYVRILHPASLGEGPTPVAVAEALIPVLARHTRTAERCWFGLWEGYGRWDFSRFPTFETPYRGEVLLEGPLFDVLSPLAWDEFAELPDLWWPKDRAWCLGGDVDLISTYVGGSEALIEELLADGGLETHRVTAADPVY